MGKIHYGYNIMKDNSLEENSLKKWLELCNTIYKCPRELRDNILAYFLDTSLEDYLISNNSKPTTSALKIVQYWDTNSIPEDVLKLMDSWKNIYGDRYTRFDDERAKFFIESNFPESYIDAYCKCWHPAMKSDFFRLCYLWVNGGYYIDADEAAKSKLPIFNYDDNIIILRPYINSLDGKLPNVKIKQYHQEKNWCKFGIYFNNFPIITSKHNQVIKIALINAKNLINSHTTEKISIHSITGPNNLTASLIVSALKTSILNEQKINVLAIDWGNYVDDLESNRLDYKKDSRNWRQYENIK